MSLDELPAMRQRVLTSAQAAGRDAGALTCALNLGVRINEIVDDRQSSLARPIRSLSN